MSLSAIRMAIHLSGLDMELFSNEEDNNNNNALMPLPPLPPMTTTIIQQRIQSPALSTSSGRSSSSGFGSWTSDLQHFGDEDEKAPLIINTQNWHEIKYENRNLLDLGANIRDDNAEWNLRFTQLPRNTEQFFNNRSVYSRVNGDKIPTHIDIPCPTCKFVNSYYF